MDFYGFLDPTQTPNQNLEKQLVILSTISASFGQPFGTQIPYSVALIFLVSGIFVLRF
jgi:hypothetical protein